MKHTFVGSFCSACGKQLTTDAKEDCSGRLPSGKNYDDSPIAEIISGFDVEWLERCAGTYISVRTSALIRLLKELKK